MGEHTPADTVEIKVKDEEIIKIDQIAIKAMYTPGHTSDSYSFLMDHPLFQILNLAIMIFCPKLKSVLYLGLVWIIHLMEPS